MNLQNLRWPVVFIAMAATLAVLMGAGFLLKNQTVDAPLKQLYAMSPDVAGSEYERLGSEYVIKLKLKDVPDLAAAYVRLDEATGKVLKGTPYQLHVEDYRSANLESHLRRINLYVQEGLVTGQFAAMADRIESEAAKAGIAARVAVDSNRVYVQLHENGTYLYSVVDRTPAPAQAKKPASAMEGGLGL